MGEVVGSLSSVTSKHRTDGQSMRRVRGNSHIELGGFGVFSSGDLKASSYMVIFFLGKESSRGPFSWPLLAWIPSLYHSGCVLGTSTVYLKMWLPGVNSYCSELPRAPGLACIFVCVYCFDFFWGRWRRRRWTSHCSQSIQLFSHNFSSEPLWRTDSRGEYSLSFIRLLDPNKKCNNLRIQKTHTAGIARFIWGSDEHPFLWHNLYLNIWQFLTSCVNVHVLVRSSKYFADSFFE